MEQTSFKMPLSKFIVKNTTESTLGKFNYTSHTAEYYEKEYAGFSKNVYKILERASQSPEKTVYMTDSIIKKSEDIVDE